jgi:RNA ligase (TIGR02306 family)
MDIELDNDRKLASIVKVKNIYPIENADRIVLVEINGWKCIVKKDEFNIGDLAIYFSIDSIPDLNDPNTSFIKDKGGRIKTIKMRGVISQGLLAPLKWLKSRGHDITLLKEGDDVTQQMGVIKYISPEEFPQYDSSGNLSSGPVKKFPQYVPKTDEKRIQDQPSFFDKIKGRNIVITRKEDGSSCTFIFNNGKFETCSRNFVLSEDSESAKMYMSIKNKFDIEKKMTEYGANIAIQGELVGPKVNGNRLELNEYDFRVFNVYNIATQSYMLHSDVYNICTMFGLHMVPEIYYGNADKLELNVNYFLKLAKQQEYVKGKHAEGIVIKTDDAGPRVSFKVISNEYLLKHNL